MVHWVYLCSISDNIKSDKLNKDKLHNKIRFFFLSDFSTERFSRDFIKMSSAQELRKVKE